MDLSLACLSILLFYFFKNGGDKYQSVKKKSVILKDPIFLTWRPNYWLMLKLATAFQDTYGENFWNSVFTELRATESVTCNVILFSFMMKHHNFKLQNIL